MQPHRSRFYKGIPGFTVSSDDGLLKAADASIYKWWWTFMRLSPVFWYARQTGLSPVIPEMAETLEKVGDLSVPNFGLWWNKHGKYLFEEAKRPAKLRLINVDEPVEHELYQKSIVVEIPLTITSKKIVNDLRALLKDIEHSVSGRNVIQQSNATLKLKSKKFNLTTIEHEYWVLIYKILHPDIPVWKIGDRLQLAPNNVVRGVDPRAVAGSFSRGRGPFATLQSLTGRSLYKARFARHHVEHGSFPNYSRVPEVENIQPFGAKHHKEFMAATYEDSATLSQNHASDSPWQQHLRAEYEKSLHYEILTANRMNQRFISDRKFKQQFPEFVSGQLDFQ